ncbi:hypothetical protein BS78_08G060500 [Paspalum vaginatum]|nr:hypothetical protein BS78_08G060500 [Paspalum vaginatum]
MPKKAIDYSIKGQDDQLKEFKFQDEILWQRHPGIQGVRFDCQTHVNFYNSVVRAKVKQPVLNQRCIDWERCQGMNDKNMDDALSILHNRCFKQIMTFHHAWNSEVIAQFYSTLWIENPKKEGGMYKFPYLHFNIQGQWYKCSYQRFAHILGFSDSDINKNNVCAHEYNIAGVDDIVNDMHMDRTGTFWVSRNMKPPIRYLNHLLRVTVVPKGGDQTEILSRSHTILWLLHPGNEDKTINVFDLIYQEVCRASWNPLRGCVHAPYLMKMIEVVTQQRYLPLDGKCSKYKPCWVYLEDEAQTVEEEASPCPAVHPSASMPPHGTGQVETLDAVLGFMKRRWEGWWKASREQNARLEVIEKLQHEILEHVKSIRRDSATGSSPKISPPREYVPPSLG